MTLTANLTEQRCTRTPPALDGQALDDLLAQVPGWAVSDGMLRASFSFRDYHHTMAFVNALAWVSHSQDHHPELVVRYQVCAVGYATHSAGGALTANDFICAARASALYAQQGAA